MTFPRIIISNKATTLARHIAFAIWYRENATIRGCYGHDMILLRKWYGFASKMIWFLLRKRYGFCFENDMKLLCPPSQLSGSPSRLSGRCFSRLGPGTRTKGPPPTRQAYRLSPTKGLGVGVWHASEPPPFFKSADRRC